MSGHCPSIRLEPVRT